MTHEPDGAPRLRADDPATLPAPGPQDGQWKGLDPRYIRVRVISEVIGYLIFAAAVGWPLVLKLVGVWGEASWWAVLPWPLGVAVLCLVQVLLTPRRVRSYGYREDADDFMVRKGLLVRTLVVVPYGRMQYVDVSSGPILRMFGLSSITSDAGSRCSRVLALTAPLVSVVVVLVGWVIAGPPHGRGAVGWPGWSRSFFAPAG